MCWLPNRIGNNHATLLLTNRSQSWCVIFMQVLSSSSDLSGGECVVFIEVSQWSEWGKKLTHTMQLTYWKAVGTCWVHSHTESGWWECQCSRLRVESRPSRWTSASCSAEIESTKPSPYRRSFKLDFRSKDTGSLWWAPKIIELHYEGALPWIIRDITKWSSNPIYFGGKSSSELILWG